MYTRYWYLYSVKIYPQNLGYVYWYNGSENIHIITGLYLTLLHGGGDNYGAPPANQPTLVKGQCHEISLFVKQHFLILKVLHSVITGISELTSRILNQIFNYERDSRAPILIERVVHKFAGGQIAL